MNNLSTALDKNFLPKTREQVLAVELATTLCDTKNFACYVSLAKRYQESYLRRILGLVMETPKENIKKSRGALFVYLVKNFNHHS